jgi:hypothetical protein
MIYFGRRYSVTLRQTIVRQVRCEKCNASYNYPVVRTAVGTGRSAYMLDNAGAQSRAKASAQSKLQAAISNGVEVVPCPSCGWLQQNMVRLLRDRQYVWTFPAGLATAIVAGFVALVVALLAWNGSALLFIPSAVLLLIATGGVGLIFLGRAWREKFDPNAGNGAGARPVPARPVASGPSIAAPAMAAGPPVNRAPQMPPIPLGNSFPIQGVGRRFGPAEIATISSIGLVLLVVVAIGATTIYHIATASTSPARSPTASVQFASPPVRTSFVPPPRTSMPPATPPAVQRASPSSTSTPNVSSSAPPSVPKFKTSQTAIVGGHGGGAYTRSNSVADPILGFRYEIGTWDRQSVIHRLDPLYSIAAANTDPERPRINRHPHVLMARDGYVVGGLMVDGENYANAIRVIFIRANGKTLNPADTYMSDWLGVPINDHPTQLAGKGERVIGICGRKGLNFDALGLVIAQ